MAATGMVVASKYGNTASLIYQLIDNRFKNGLGAWGW